MSETTNSKRLVIKVGTGALRQNGHLSDSVFFNIAAQIAEVKRQGYDVVLVTSGAVDAAREWLTLLGKDFSTLSAGELSSIGTSELLERWKKAFLPHGLVVATGWLTHSVWNHRNQRENLRKSGAKLSGSYTVLVVNENDLLSRSELKRMKKGEGDNDYLARRVACLLNVDAILFLTESGGIFNGSPTDPTTLMYEELDGRKTFRLGKKNGGKSETGTGGPQSKVNHASYCYRRMIRSAIAGVAERKVIVRFTSGERVGTFIGDKTVLAG